MMHLLKAAQCRMEVLTVDEKREEEEEEDGLTVKEQSNVGSLG